MLTADALRCDLHALLLTATHRPPCLPPPRAPPSCSSPCHSARSPRILLTSYCNCLPRGRPLLRAPTRRSPWPRTPAMVHPVCRTPRRPCPAPDPLPRAPAVPLRPSPPTRATIMPLASPPMRAAAAPRPSASPSGRCCRAARAPLMQLSTRTATSSRGCPAVAAGTSSGAPRLYGLSRSPFARARLALWAND